MRSFFPAMGLGNPPQHPGPLAFELPPYLGSYLLTLLHRVDDHRRPGMDLSLAIPGHHHSSSAPPPSSAGRTRPAPLAL